MRQHFGVLFVAIGSLVMGSFLPFGNRKLVGQERPYGLKQRVTWTTSRVQGAPEPPARYRTERAFPKLKFNEPLEMDAVPGTDRLFVVERYGKVFSFVNRPDVENADLFLDLGKVIYGVAFHPKFVDNGYVFVCYIRDPAQEEPEGTHVSRFTAMKDSQGVSRCDPRSELRLLQWPSGGHNGGCLRFGPDGMLYIATGDSSGINDQRLTGQDLGDLSGAILRIDVDHPAGDRNYGIPQDNPFTGVAGARPENWAYGLRQPWKMHFDRQTGDLWSGNVGQDLWEQIVLIERGGNYGWSVMEGSHPFRPARPRGPSPFVAPIVEHDHAEFRSITGGSVYHGKRLKELRGAYIYGDYDTGKLWMLRYDRPSQKVTDWQELVDTNLRIVGFAEDADGELFLVDHMGGGLHRIVPNAARSATSEFPRQLSATGLFTSTSRHELAPGVLPYSVIAPQWCDGASKVRFFAVPGSSQIEFETVTYPQPAPGSLPGWRFPDGTVIAETLSLELEPGNASTRRRIETRLLHYEQLAGSEEVGDQFWRGYTYLWNDEQTDAVLVDAGGADRTFTILDRTSSNRSTTNRAKPAAKGRSQTWHFPSRAECTVCHNMAAKYVLGLTTNQVNRDHDYDGTIDNQLRTWEHIGLFTKPFPKPASEMVRLVDYADKTHDVGVRARSYLHANCSHCHRKWGGGNTEFQLLATLEPKELGIIGMKPAHGGFFMADAEILAAGDPFRSTLFYRVAKLGPGRMPRLGSDVVDDAGVQLLQDWITSLPSESQRPSTDASASALAVLSSSPSPSGATLERAIGEALSTTRSALRLALAIDQGHISPEIKQAIVTQANGSSEAHVRDLFEKYLPEEQRPKRLGTAVQPSVILGLTGNAEQGRQLFFNTAGVQCRNCHQIQGQGTAIGPELTQIGKKHERAKLLDNLLNPSREIDPKFQVYLAETKDGRVQSGLMVERTEQVVVLKDAKNQLLRLAVSDLEQLTPQQQSLMPDLLLRDLTAQQVSDLLAFLSSLR